MKRILVLVILDGWGIGQNDESNPLFKANLKTFDFLKTHFPFASLQASGLGIGLAWNEEGNSEVGHLTIGAGRIVHQHFPEISRAIEDGSFFQKETLKKAFAHARECQTAVHLVGLLSNGNVHSSFSHLAALIKMAKMENCPKLYLHLFTDGRDSLPQSAPELLQKLDEEIKKQNIGQLVSLAGRYYGMDRDRHWDRTQKTYELLTNEKSFPIINDPLEELKKLYGKDLSDEFLPPIIIKEPHPIKDKEAVIFFNFREDRMKQISEAFVNSQFKEFPVKTFSDLLIVAMTEYEKGFNVPVVFPKEIIKNTLGEVLAEHQKTQLRIAETEKYNHVTYFFNGLREQPFPNEYRVLIPSRVLVHQEEHPEMMAREITERVLSALNEATFDFVLVNYANPDMIAHTGNYEATVKTAQIIDQEMEKLFKKVLALNHFLIITSDHGNAERLINLRTAEVQPQHKNSPVPFHLIAKEFQFAQNERQVATAERNPLGMLSDIAPTILELMKIPKPPEMTGQSLLSQLLTNR
ncbi:2,3-bisphosphoglycerate-independent phosphoglycerate mutase [Candidatus Jorgensenbacteria bacterium CG03_land_8_20_14_0_80_38_39]|nr:MAG: 2,3-bisphosphoglycerate-independent phosphoglycerate mutase [Candidatus Jorgensenbacteria bacterium CG03_land_8_20_14_0_80_38_39]